MKELRIVLKIAAVIFTVEALIMVAMSAYVNISLQLYGVLDAFALVVISSPIIYFLIIRPYIAARNIAESARQYSEQIFRSVAQSVTDAIVAIDSDGKIVFWNNGATQIFGYKAEEMLGNDTEKIMPIHFHADHKAALQRLKEGGKAHNMGITVPRTGVTKDGTTISLELTLGKWESEGETYYSGVLRDVSERNAQQALARQADKMNAVGDLAGGISHDLKNMLFPIISLTSMTIRDLPDGDRAKLRLNKVMQAGERALSLVHRIHAFSHVDENERETVDVSLVLEEALAILHDTIPSTITLTESIQPDAGYVRVDVSQLHAALMNLFSNSAQAMEGKIGKIVIEVTTCERKHDDLSPLKGDGFARITVTDTGSGMDKEILERIFDPYFTTKRKGQGTGLGMAMVQKFLTQNDGTITVDSTLGEGTTFRIFLPLVDPQSPANP